MLDFTLFPPVIAPILERYWQRLCDTEASAAEPRLSTLAQQDTAFGHQLLQLWSASDYAATLCVQTPGLLLDLIARGELQRAEKQDYHEELAARPSRRPC